MATDEFTGLNMSDNSSIIDLYAVQPVKDILIATFVTVFVISLAGNLLVIYVIVRNRSMHTVTNFFLLNLAISDLLVTLCCILPTLLWFIQVSWTLGAFVCKAHKATITMTTTASVFMLTVISMERFIAILYPFQTKRILTVQRLIGVVVVVWLLSITISIPMFVFYDVVSYQDDVYCLASQSFLESGARSQGVFMICLCYLVPLLIMLVLYTKISQSLWARSRTGNDPLDALPGRSSHKSKANLKVTYKGNKVISSAEKRSSAPSGEGLRIHIGSQMSPPPGENTSVHSEAEDTPHRSLLRDSRGRSPSNTRHAPEMIGPFFVDEPDQNDKHLLGDEDANNSSVLWRSCNDILLCSADGKASLDQNRLEAGEGGTNANGLGTHREISKSENALNAQRDEGNQTPNHAKVDGKEPSHRFDLERIYEGVKSRLTTKSEGDKKSGHRKYEPVTTSSAQSSPASRGGNPHSMSRQCLKKTSSSKRKRNAEAVMHARRKVIRLLVIMVVCFAVCLFPLQLMFVWSLFGGFSDSTVGGALVTAFTYLAYFTNSAINPFLYAFLSDNFRTKMKDTMRCGSNRARRQASLRQIRLKSMTSDAFTESELMPS